MECLASDLIGLSTRQNFAHWLAIGSVLRGWARSASGEIAEGISWIEDGIRDFRATGSIIGLPFLLALKAEALHLRIVPPKLLRQSGRQKHWPKDLKNVIGVPNCTGYAVCFSRLWVQTRPKLRLRFASHQNRKGAEVGFARETRRSNLRRIPPAKKEWVRRTWIPTISLVTLKRKISKIANTFDRTLRIILLAWLSPGFLRFRPPDCRKRTRRRRFDNRDYPEFRTIAEPSTIPDSPRGTPQENKRPSLRAPTSHGGLHN